MSNDVDCIATANLKPDVNLAIRRYSGNQFANPVVTYPGGASASASGRQLISIQHTTFDGKTLNADDPLIFENVGTGASTFLGNNVALSVTAGQYIIRQQIIHNPYFSGKPQHIQATHYDFTSQAGLVKRIGYYSSSSVAPYSANLDGWWIEDDSLNKYLITSRSGTITHRIALTQNGELAAGSVIADRIDLIENYDWSKFTVSDVDFLWLGGAYLRLKMTIDGIPETIHIIDKHAGYQSGLMFESPNHPVRAEIRSTSGVGSMVFCCCAVGSEGGADQQGRAVPIYNPTPLACNSAGTIYALCGIKIDTAHHDRHVNIESISGGITSASTDAGMFLLCYEPTLSAPLTWTNKQRVQSGLASTNTTVSNTGTEVFAMAVVSNSGTIEIAHNIMSALRIDITHTPKALVLCYIPATSNQSVTGVINASIY